MESGCVSRQIQLYVCVGASRQIDKKTNGLLSSIFLQQGVLLPPDKVPVFQHCKKMLKEQVEN